MKNKLLKNTEWGIVIYCVILFVIGCVALFSTTQSADYEEFKKQLQWFAIAIPFIILATVVDYNLITRLSPFLYITIIGLLIGVLFTEPINGASSWFNLGFLSLQPSEFAKIIVIIFLAYMMNILQTKGRKEINKPHKLFVALTIIAIPVLLILLQPDYGTAMAFIVAFAFMLFVSGIDKRYIFAVILLICIAVPVAYQYVLPDHAIRRIEVFLNPGLDPLGDGYNITQSKLAIGAGKVLGMGLLNGNQTQLGYLHPKTTDFIFSVIGEELGFVATGSIVILYIFLVTKAVYVAKTAKDNEGSYIAIGIAGIFFFHMTENIGMTIGLMPITGVPLPFVSYGGSSLLTNFILIGLLLNISSRRQKSIFIE